MNKMHMRATTHYYTRKPCVYSTCVLRADLNHVDVGTLLLYYTSSVRSVRVGTSNNIPCRVLYSINLYDSVMIRVSWLESHVVVTSTSSTVVE